MVLDLDPSMINLKSIDLFQDSEDMFVIKENLSDVDESFEDFEDFNEKIPQKSFKNKEKRKSTSSKAKKHEKRSRHHIDEATLKRYETRKAQRLDHRTSEYSCLICKTDLILNYKEYNNHMEKHKLQKHPAPHSCATCKRDFYKIYAYINHKCAVQQKCFICNTEVQCFARLNFHLRREHLHEKLEW